MQPYFKAIWRKSKVRNELIVQNVRPMIESTPLLEKTLQEQILTADYESCWGYHPGPLLMKLTRLRAEL